MAATQVPSAMATAATDLEMMDRQRQGFNSKVEELQSNKASNSRFLTREEQENQIRRLEDLESKLVKPTLSDTNLMKGRSLLVIETNGGLVKKLVRPGTNLRFVPVEEMFDVLRKEHELSNHGGRDIMQDKLKKKYANITVELINTFKDTCLKCGLKKARARKGVVVKPILTPRAWHRWQTDLIDMQSQPDGEFRFIQHTQDHFTKYCFLQPLKRKTAANVAENLSFCFSVLGPPACILQSDNGREFKNAEVVGMIKKSWPGLKMVHGKPRHSQSQGSVERGNRDLEAMLATAMADHKTTSWASLLPMIQLQKNSRFHSGIGRSPLQALTGKAPTYGLEGLNLPEEVLSSLETEEDLMKALGMEENEETVIVKEEEEKMEQEEQKEEEEEDKFVQPEEVQRNIVAALETLAETLQPKEKDLTRHSEGESEGEGPRKKPKKNPVRVVLQLEGQDHSGMDSLLDTGFHTMEDKQEAPQELDVQLTCITCSMEFQGARGFCSECHAAAHNTLNCLFKSFYNKGSMLCKYCKNSEEIMVERESVKARQERQAEAMLARSARRFAPAVVGDNVRVYLSEVDRGRCEFPNVLALVTEVTPEGMFKLATKEGYLNSHYSRNQFEPLPSKHLLLSEVDTSKSRPLRTAAHDQSQGGGQGFTKCGCTTSCNANNCKCFKSNAICNSRCHGRAPNVKCLNHN